MPPVAGERLPEALFARMLGGGGGHLTLLLHGLSSTGDVFGASFDQLAKDGELIVPDLLGFGRSMDDSRGEFSLDDHLAALDNLVKPESRAPRSITIGAHSMGSALALHWAGRHSALVDRVVTWGAPIYPDATTARKKIGGSAMTKLFALDTAWAQRACALSCRHRAVAGWAAAAFAPQLPIPISRAASQHTWPAYRDAMRHLVLETDWQRLLTTTDTAKIDVEMVWGSRDKIGETDFAAGIISDLDQVSLTTVAGADHHLPIIHPQFCVDALSFADTVDNQGQGAASP